MSFAAKIVVTNSVSMATSVTPSSIPSLFAISKASYTNPCLSIQFRPLKLHLSCSYSSSLSLSNFLSRKQKQSVFRVSVIASGQDENNPVAIEEKEPEFQGDFNWGASENDGFAEPPEEPKVYVGNFPYDVDDDQLAKMFEEAGVVEVVEVKRHRDTNQSRGFGFVTMSTMEEVEKAVEMFHRYEVDGRTLVVNKAAPKGSKPELSSRVFGSNSRIYVGNLPWSADDARLEQLFGEYGRVVSARVVSDRENGRSRGFGFVEMSSDSEMNDAIANLDGQSVDGRPIRVNVASDSRRSSF